MKTLRRHNPISSQRILVILGCLAVCYFVSGTKSARELLAKDSSFVTKCSMEYTGRYAYLILAHKNMIQLRLLLELLDDPRNDLYILIDKKVRTPPIEHLRLAVTVLRVTFVKSITVTWGAFSQIWVKLLLLDAATKHYYDYYHLLSGSDLPIQSRTVFSASVAVLLVKRMDGI